MCAAGAVAALGRGGIWLAKELARGPTWLPAWLWLGLSLAAPLALLAFALRMRPKSGRSLESLEWLGPGAGLLVAVVVCTAMFSNALGVADPILLVCLGAIPLTGAAAIWIVHADEGRKRRGTAAAALILALLSTFLVGWPIRATVWLWREPLKAVADRAERGEKVATPIWIGPLRISEVYRPYKYVGSPPRTVPAGVFLVTCHPYGGRGGLMTVEEAENWSLGWNRRVSARWSFVFED